MATDTKRKTMGEKMDELLAALNTLAKRQDELEAARTGSPEEREAKEEVAAAEEKLETKAKAAGLSEEDIILIADRVIDRWDEREQAAAAAAAEKPAEGTEEATTKDGGEAKTALENLEEGKPPPEEGKPAEGEPVKEDAPPAKKHWSQRKVFGGDDD